MGKSRVKVKKNYSKALILSNFYEMLKLSTTLMQKEVEKAVETLLQYLGKGKNPRLRSKICDHIHRVFDRSVSNGILNLQACIEPASGYFELYHENILLIKSYV